MKQTKHLEFRSQKQRIDYLLRVGEKLNNHEMKSHWARYLCVLVSGLIEIAVQEILGEYTKRRAGPEVSRYVARQLGYFTNPRMEKILQLVAAFDQNWHTMLKQYAEGERSDAVDSIVANRNQIAHGRNVSLTLAQLKQYYNKAYEVVRWLETTVLGP